MIYPELVAYVAALEGQLSLLDSELHFRSQYKMDEPADNYEYVVSQAATALGFLTKAPRFFRPTHKFASHYGKVEIQELSPALYQRATTPKAKLGKRADATSIPGEQTKKREQRVVHLFNLCTFPRTVSPSRCPFGSCVPRDKGLIKNSNPGPGHYNPKQPVCDRHHLIHSFGGRVVLDAGVDIKCCPENKDICFVCGLKPVGDYWHVGTSLYICRKCLPSANLMTWQKPKLRKMRTCSEFHHHEGGSAYITKVFPKVVRRRLTREAYFYHFYKK